MTYRKVVSVERVARDAGTWLALLPKARYSTLTLALARRDEPAGAGGGAFICSPEGKWELEAGTLAGSDMLATSWQFWAHKQSMQEEMRLEDVAKI